MFYGGGSGNVFYYVSEFCVFMVYVMVVGIIYDFGVFD